MAQVSKTPQQASALPGAIVICLVLYGLAYFTVTTTSADDLYECKAIVKAVEAKHEIPTSSSAPGEPGIFCSKGVRFPFLTSYDTLFVYGVTDKSAQDSIVKTLEDARRESHIRDVFVRFFDRENWKTWSDPDSGRSGGERGPETPIREAWIR